MTSFGKPQRAAGQGEGRAKLYFFIVFLQYKRVPTTDALGFLLQDSGGWVCTYPANQFFSSSG